MASVGRFERDDSNVAKLPQALGTATEGLRSTIEVEVAKIVGSAEARAAAIKDRAVEKASRIEQESDRREAQAFDDSKMRLAQMFAEIEAVERVVGTAVGTLRAEAEGLAGDLEAAGTQPLEETDPPATGDQAEPADAAPAPPEGSAESDVAESDVAESDVAESDVAESVHAESDGAESDGEAGMAQPSDPEVRELIRQQLLSLAEGGRTRTDAQRMLLRFKQGEQYFDLLDEIYPNEPGGRRGLLRRRKDRD
jgi:hypothetical protein